MKILNISSAPYRPPAVSMANKLESAFLAEMLKHIAPSPNGPFSGGAGEQHFGSWLVEARAEAFASRIDLRLGDKIGGSHE